MVYIHMIVNTGRRLTVDWPQRGPTRIADTRHVLDDAVYLVMEKPSPDCAPSIRGFGFDTKTVDSERYRFVALYQPAKAWCQDSAVAGFAYLK